MRNNSIFDIKVNLNDILNQIPKLSSDEKTQGQVFMIGNDPKLPEETNNYLSPNEIIGFVGTSGLRLLSIASKLNSSKDRKEKVIPQIIILDNSESVCLFWTEIKNFFYIIKNKDEFQKHFALKLKDLEQYAKQDVLKDINEKTPYLTQDVTKYLTDLFNAYGFDHIKEIITKAIIVCQSWTNSNVFVQLEKIFNLLEIKKICLYPSNIGIEVICNENSESVKNTLLKNMMFLKPYLSIHSDYCRCHRKPEKIFLFDQKSNLELTINNYKMKFLTDCSPEKTLEKNKTIDNIFTLNILFKTIPKEDQMLFRGFLSHTILDELKQFHQALLRFISTNEIDHAIGVIEKNIYHMKNENKNSCQSQSPSNRN